MNVTDIYLVYSDLNDRKRFEEADINSSPFVHYIDIETKEGKSKGYKIKSEFGARLNPFAVLYDGESPIKAYYTEDSKNIINDLIKDLCNDVSNRMDI